MTARRRAAVLAAWIAFVVRGVLQVSHAPTWDGFDEPFHVAYAEFVAEHGRPPGFGEPSFPKDYYEALPLLPSAIDHGAPDFRQWRALDSREKASRRQRASRVGAARTGSGRSYAHANYERQQPPLFYFVAAPVARLLRHAGIPRLLVGLRIFCVLLASLTVPLTARLARLILPNRGVFFALPIFCLLPNTLFFADRVANDDLAWPLLAATAIALVLASRRPGSAARFVVLGLLVAAGVWTKLSCLPALPAALVAVLLARRRRDGRRTRNLLAGVALPALLIAPLFLWNRAASGAWTGLIYPARAPWIGLKEQIAAAGTVHLSKVVGQWARSHLWAGGWGFIVPTKVTFRWAGWAAAAALVACLVSARVRRARIPGGTRWMAPVFLALFFLGAIFWHLLEATAAARALHVDALAGGEGWYFDLLRPIEACAAAALLCAALSARSARLGVAGIVAFLLALDAAGTLALLFPRWAGLDPFEPSLARLWEAVRGAREAAPIPPPPLASGLLLALLIAAWARFAWLAGPARPKTARSV